jgi:hypothetical protein
MDIGSRPQDGSQILYLNIAVSEKGLAELSGNKRIIFIPKDQVQGVEIKFGYQAERPFGLALKRRTVKSGHFS